MEDRLRPIELTKKSSLASLIELPRLKRRYQSTRGRRDILIAKESKKDLWPNERKAGRLQEKQKEEMSKG